jgi:ketosteroid isomerase-like protein
MSPRNVEIVRRFMELALERRDFEAALQLTHPDSEFDWSNSLAPYRGIYRGSAEVMQAWRTWLEAWDEWNTSITEVIEVDPETVVVVTHVRARGKGSGVAVEAGGAGVWQVRDGKIGSAKLFQSKDEALASVKHPAT